MKEFILREKFPFVMEKFPLKLLNQFHGLVKLDISIEGDLIPRPYRRLSALDVKALPRSLLDLKMGINDCFGDSHVPQFPPLLTRLLLPLNRSITSQGLLLLPKSLIELDLSSNLNIDASKLPSKIAALKSPLNLVDHPFIPPNLVSLHITEGGRPFGLGQPFPLPTGLSFLGLPSLPSVASLNFPEFLTELDFSPISLDSEALFDKIPPALRVLRLGWDMNRPPFLSDSIGSKLPPSLRVLTIMPWRYTWQQAFQAHVGTSRMTCSLLSALPRLKTLHIWVLVATMSYTEAFSLLPDSIVELNIRIGDEAQPVIGSAPASLRKIIVRSCAAAEIRMDSLPLLEHINQAKQGRVGVIHDGTPLFRGHFKRLWHPHLIKFSGDLPLSEEVQHLPRLVSLYYTKWIVDAAVLELPHGLKTLTCSFPSDLTDECIPALPHELTSLTLLESCQLTLTKYPLPASLRSLSIAESPAVDFSLLPKNLTCFHTDSALEDDSILTLPASITELRLPNTDATNFILPYLHPQLYHLELHSIILYEDDIPRLPRFLKVLKITRCPSITDFCLLQLPCLLSTLHISGEYISDAGIAHLPRSITALGLPKSTLLTGGCVPSLPPRLAHFTLPRSLPTESQVRARFPLVTVD